MTYVVQVTFEVFFDGDEPPSEEESINKAVSDGEVVHIECVSEEDD